MCLLGVQTEACGKFIAACIVIFVLVVGHHETHELPAWGFQMVHLILAVSFVEICRGAMYEVRA